MKVKKEPCSSLRLITWQQDRTICECTHPPPDSAWWPLFARAHRAPHHPQRKPKKWSQLSLLRVFIVSSCTKKYGTGQLESFSLNFMAVKVSKLSLKLSDETFSRNFQANPKLVRPRLQPPRQPSPTPPLMSVKQTTAPGRQRPPPRRRPASQLGAPGGTAPPPPRPAPGTARAGGGDVQGGI